MIFADLQTSGASFGVATQIREGHCVSSAIEFIKSDDVPPSTENDYQLVCELDDTPFKINLDPSTLADSYDWKAASIHKKFAALERKHIRGALSKEDQDVYLQMLASRRAWIDSQTYMEDYKEQQHAKRLMSAVVNLRALIKSG